MDKLNNYNLNNDKFNEEKKKQVKEMLANYLSLSESKQIYVNGYMAGLATNRETA